MKDETDPADSCRQEAEARYRSLFEESRDMIHMFDLDCRIIDVNQAELDALGYKREELIGRPVVELVSPEFRKEAKKRCKRLLLGDRIECMQMALLARDGGCVHVEASASPQFDNGRVVAGRAILRDIGDRIEAQQKSDLLASFPTFNPAPLMRVDAEGRVVYANPAAMTIFGSGFTGSDVRLVPGLNKLDVEACVRSGSQLLLFGELGDMSIQWVVQGVAEFGLLHIYGNDITERRSIEQRYRNLVEMMPDAVAVHQDGRIVYNNAVCAAMFGYDSPDGMLGVEIMQHVHPDYRKLVAQRAGDVAAGMESLPTIEEKMLRRDGSEFWAEVSAGRVEHEGRPASQVVVRDISERKQAERRLLESERRLQASQAIGHVGTWDWNPLSGELVWSDETYRILGFVPGEITPSYELFLSLLDANDREQLRMAVDAALHQQQSYSLDCRVIRRDGSERLAHAQGRVELSPAGEPVRMLGIFEDITERRQAEQRLQLTQFSLDHAPDAVYWMEPDGRFLYVNEAACHMLGYSREALLGMGVRDIDPGLPDGIPPEMAEATKQGRSFLIETTHRTRDGRIIPVEVMVGCFEYMGKDYHCSFVRDISGRKAADLALRGSEYRYRHLVDLMPDGIVLAEEGRVVFANPEALRLFGFGAGEAIGQPILERIHPDDRAAAAQRVQQLLKDRQGVNPLIEERMLRKDGSEFIAEAASSYLEYAGRPGVLVVLRDISERKAAEKKLQTIVTASPVPTVVTRHADGKVLFSNAEARRMFGVADEGEAFMISAPQVYVRPEDCYQMLAGLQESGVFKGEFELIRKNGEAFWALFSARSMEFGGEQAIIVMLIDTTAQRSLEEQFRQAQKMESVGTLVGGIAHDFNNMLAGMLGQLYLVRYELQEGELDAANVGRMVERINAVDKQGRLAADVIAQLMTFARKGQVVLDRLDVNRLVADAMRLHRVSIPENIVVRAHLGDAMEVEGDAGMIQQMLLNLLTNARDALEHQSDPCINITLARIVPDAAFLKANAEFHAGAYASLEVRDNGCGISKEQISRIFDPFYTTKSVGKGSGLGLAMLYGGMQTHHGHVLVESEPGQGSCFSLYFPLLGWGGKADEQEAQVLTRGSGQTVLLADDEPVLTEVIEQALKLTGYRVLTARNGEEAVLCFKENQAQISLAILDVVMPVKGGLEAAEEMRRIVPNLPIIFHTGYGSEAKLDAVQAWKRCRTLKKPVNIEQLSHIVAELLA
ncbi:MAG: hypothetical protein COV97_11670 [Zetaproteobacteria bacterium CG11_big_fil_rev_8_21_14_0_20_59_439]|nr:MAG: hypothetical protein COV97_11670 [Zetaproteobacteria bacterium CG11_big_fil_rev_8_21_14_0_20_59_439]